MRQMVLERAVSWGPQKESLWFGSRFRKQKCNRCDARANCGLVDSLLVSFFIQHPYIFMLRRCSMVCQFASVYDGPSFKRALAEDARGLCTLRTRLKRLFVFQSRVVWFKWTKPQPGLSDREYNNDRDVTEKQLKKYLYSAMERAHSYNMCWTFYL